MHNDTLRAAAATPVVAIGNPAENRKRIERLIAENHESDLIVFPELCMTGYTCADLFHAEYLIDSAMEETARLAQNLVTSIGYHGIVIVGLPVRMDNMLFNCAAVLDHGKIAGIVPKTYIPNYNEFYEGRWFASGAKAMHSTICVGEEVIPFGTDLLFQAKDCEAVIGIDICEDLWVPIPPSTYAAIAGANILVNLSASNETIGKKEYRRNLVSVHSAKTISAYIYSSAGTNESSTDLVFSGHSLIAVNGKIVRENIYPMQAHIESAVIDLEALNSDRRKFNTYMPAEQIKPYRMIQCRNQSSNELPQSDPYPFVPKQTADRQRRCNEITDIQANGLATRLRNSGINKMVIGISGGLDSTLALLVAAKACDIIGVSKDHIICLTMPGFGTTKNTKNNAVDLVRKLGCTLKEIDIRQEAALHLKMMGRSTEYQGKGDVTFENVQARIRTLYLMNTANEEGALVIGTGDLSELALGWCTYNGDHMSMYAVNVGIPKTLVKYLVMGYKQEFPALTNVLASICDTPISPELVPTSETGEMVQKTEDSIGKYDLHDFFLFYFVRYGYAPEKIFRLAQKTFLGKISREEIRKTLNTFLTRFASQQFKRSCLPDGPKVGSVTLSPRGDWRMPSDNIYIPHI